MGASQQSKLRIVVSGYLVRAPLGGMAWHYIHYALGFRELGHEVLFVEDSDDYDSCYNPSTFAMGKDPSYGLEFASTAFQGVGLGEQWAYYDAHKRCWHGPKGHTAEQFCRDAEVFVNVSFASPIRPWSEPIGTRILIDTDPAFEQVRQLTDPARQRLAHRHNHHFSFGENIGRAGCSIVDDGIRWQPTRQPIALSHWPPRPLIAGGSYTTVMQWDSYSPREYRGVPYGMKSHSFGDYIDLPRRVSTSLEIALGSESAPRELLRESGWKLVDPIRTTRTIDSYSDYIAHSRGEFTVAKHGYVISNSGWFSERSAAYLASAKPVITQNTGFTVNIPTGVGLIAYETLDQAVAALEDVERRYEFHCSAASDLAREHFDGVRILSRLLDVAFNN